MQQPGFTVKIEETNHTYTKFALEPLENGYGHTMGNALRRVLLGSLKGAAITKVKVDGVNHKFSTHEGMSEDMIDLMLNLKAVKVAYSGDEPVHATISVKGRVVTAKDIDAPTSVKIINPEVLIATLGKDAKLDLNLEISSGYGYSPAEDRTSDSVGEIVLDAIFSPVTSVTYHIETTRVGRRTDYDKLVLEMHTDGSQDGESILKDAASILVAHFGQIISPLQVADVPSVIKQSSSDSSFGIDDLGLPTRIANALKNAGYKTVAELATATDKDLKGVKNLGGKSVEELDAALVSKGLNRNK
ncbi:MAG: DNA-directed RNA polymerase subunit alpha [bacterium]